MNAPTPQARLVCRSCLALLAGTFCLPVRAEEPKPAPEKRVEAATCATAKGSILRRERPDGKWQVVDKNEKLSTGDLLVGLPGAHLDAKDGAVRLTFLTDFGNSPFPVIECAVVLHDPAGDNLNFTLDRGRADLINTKKEGAARVRVHVLKETFELALEEPGARVALELYGRWPPGTRFNKNPGPKDVPNLNLVVLVLKGEARLKHGAKTFTLSAPPGPALIQWDNVGGWDAAVHKLDKQPEWALPKTEDTPKIQRMKKNLAHYYELIGSKSPEEVVDAFLASDDPDYRRAALILSGALDQLGRIAPVLRQPKYAAQWDDAIVVLRHWLGRGPGQEQRLYKGLLDSKLYGPVEAETVLQLLFNFSEADLADPATYEALLDYLEDERVLIRALANWHLRRLVPAGDKIKYNPVGDKDERAAAVKEWRKLIPRGKLPPKPGEK